MTTETARERFKKYSASLASRCTENPKIIGLVLVGSTAQTERVDEWSDHDFFVLTEEGDQEALRQNLDWLPDHKSICFSFRETEHGLKVVYQSGAVLEFAVFSCSELSTCTVNHHQLVFGNDEVAQALRVATSRLPKIPVGDDLADFRHFLSVLIIQVGRARRGELITATQGIVGPATSALLKVFTRQMPRDQRSDQLDVSRRFEFVHPEIGKAIAETLILPTEQMALRLLEIADQYLRPAWADYPREEVNTVRDVLSHRA